MDYPGFVGGSVPAQSVVLDAERTVNLYVEKAQSPGAQHTAALYPSPGYTAFAQSAVVDPLGRGVCVAEGRLFTVHGGNLYEWDVTGTPTQRSTFVMAIGSGPSQLVYTGKVGGAIGIQSGGNVYSFTLATNTFAGPHLVGECSSLAVANNVGLAFDRTTGRVRLSGVNDITTWPAGVFFQRALQNDPWQAMFVDTNNLVWLPGTETFEVWRLANSASTQPFAPLLGLAGRFGIVSTFAYTVNAAGVFWLSASAEGAGVIVQSQGGLPQAISSYALNAKVSDYQRTGVVSDAEMFSYADDGHIWAVLNFPSIPATWVYDATDPSWTERGVFNSTRGDYDLWTPRYHAFCFGKHLIIDRTSGKVWQMDRTSSLEIDGTPITWDRRAPAFTKEHKRFNLNQLELLMDTGLGLQSGLGADPQVMLRVSQDAGRTWGNERRASFGRAGEYRTRVYWTRLGCPSDAAFWVRGNPAVPARIVNAWLNNFEQVA